MGYQLIKWIQPRLICANSIAILSPDLTKNVVVFYFFRTILEHICYSQFRLYPDILRPDCCSPLTARAMPELSFALFLMNHSYYFFRFCVIYLTFFWLHGLSLNMSISGLDQF
ncbi:hypothetical protein DSUL_160065 [Desulfovibrionales bacterium]